MIAPKYITGKFVINTRFILSLHVEQDAVIIVRLGDDTCYVTTYTESYFDQLVMAFRHDRIVELTDGCFELTYSEVDDFVTETLA